MPRQKFDTFEETIGSGEGFVPGLISRTVALADRAPLPAALEARSREPAMELAIHALPERVSRLRRAAQRFAAVYGAASSDDVAFAIQEAVANAVIHGYADQPGIVRLLGVRRPGEMVFVVEDYGNGLSPTEDTPGLGLVVITEVVEKVEITSYAGYGTRVRMTFAVTGRAPLQA